MTNTPSSTHTNIAISPKIIKQIKFLNGSTTVYNNMLWICVCLYTCMYIFTYIYTDIKLLYWSLLDIFYVSSFNLKTTLQATQPGRDVPQASLLTDGGCKLGVLENDSRCFFTPRSNLSKSQGWRKTDQSVFSSRISQVTVTGFILYDSQLLVYPSF